MARPKMVSGSPVISALVIRCSKQQYEKKEILTYLRIKAKLTTISSVVLAVEDAGKYEYFILRDVYYFRNVNSPVTEKPYSIKWIECPEIATKKQMLDATRNQVQNFLNSDHGLDTGYVETYLEAAAHVRLTHCSRFFIDPATTSFRSTPKRIVERNPFLKDATLGEVMRELKRRGYEMTYKPLE